MEKFLKFLSCTTLTLSVLIPSVSFASTDIRMDSNSNVIGFQVDGFDAKGIYDGLAVSAEEHKTSEHVVMPTRNDVRQYDVQHLDYSVKVYSALDQSFSLRCTRLPYKTLNALVGRELLSHYVCEGSLKLNAEENNKKSSEISHDLKDAAALDLAKAMGMVQDLQDNAQRDFSISRGANDGLLFECKVANNSFAGCSIELKRPIESEVQYMK